MKPNTPNFAHIEGRLVAEPRTNPNAGESGVTNFTLEVAAGFKDYTLKLGVVAWHSDCEVPDGLRVGDYVIAEGRIAVRSYADRKDATKKIYVTEIIATDIDAPKHKRAATAPAKSRQPDEREGATSAPDDDLPF